MKKFYITTITLLILSVRFCNAQTAYIPNSGDSTVSVIDLQTNIVTHTIHVGYVPWGVSVSSDGTKVYIGNANDFTISVINTQTNSVSATFNSGYYPVGIAVSPDGTKLYISNGNSDTVTVINTVADTVLAKIIVGLGPIGLAVSPNGNEVYVAIHGYGVVQVINTATNVISGQINVGTYPYGVAFSPDGSKVYVTNYNGYSVSVINTATHSVSTTIGVGGSPTGICVSPDGSRVYVVSEQNTITIVNVINAATNTVSDTIPVGSSPKGISISPDGSKLLVANSGGTNGHTVTEINTANNTVSATINVGTSPCSFGNFISIYNPLCFAHYTTTYDSITNNFTLVVDSTAAAIAVSYHWDFGDGTTSSLPAPSHTFSMDTTYDVCMKIYTASGDSCEYCHYIGKDYLGHIYRTAGFTLNVHNPSAGINEINNKETEITISPNPFTSQTTISFSESQKNTTIKITDVLGQIVKSEQITGNSAVLDMSGASKGIYFVQIQTNPSASLREPVILNKKIVVQ